MIVGQVALTKQNLRLLKTRLFYDLAKKYGGEFFKRLEQPDNVPKVDITSEYMFPIGREVSFDLIVLDVSYLDYLSQDDTLKRLGEPIGDYPTGLFSIGKVMCCIVELLDNILEDWDIQIYKFQTEEELEEKIKEVNKYRKITRYIYTEKGVRKT